MEEQFEEDEPTFCEVTFCFNGENINWNETQSDNFLLQFKEKLKS